MFVFRAMDKIHLYLDTIEDKAPREITEDQAAVLADQLWQIADLLQDIVEAQGWDPNQDSSSDVE
jgi:hypothetical protein